MLSCPVFLAGSDVARAQGDYGDSVINREYPIKAAFLYNFGNYVTWPEEAFTGPQAPFVVGILGSGSFGDSLDRISAQKKVGGRRIVVEQLTADDSPDHCHILFITRTASRADVSALLAKARDEPVLIVGESPDFARRGGCVNFIVEGNKTRFEINAAEAKRRQLVVSAKLLSLAHLVDETAQSKPDAPPGRSR
ncbi:MAG TPA: YfiR family protein [Pirellulales bacterium]|nr:YfiR family protein [Pirellulales bacterium]